MRQFCIIITLWIGVVATLNAQFFLEHRRKSFRSTKAAFSDNFDRANSDSLGASWTEIAGDIDILSNVASAPQTYDNVHRAAAYTGTACTTVNQYVKVTIGGATLQRQGVVFRYTDASSPHYEIQFDDNNDLVRWLRWATPASAGSSITTASLSISIPMTIGITCEGTGTSTVIRIWVSPPTDTPSSATDWGGDTTPNVTLTTDPASPVDTGNYVGIGLSVSPGTACTWNDFFGGDIP